jgi:septal ring factor EnvC (AmiA/AmiB activator)
MRLCCFFLGLFCSVILFSQTKDDLEKRRANTLKEIQETETLLNTISASKSKSIERISLLERKITLRNQVIDNLSSELSHVDLQLLESEKMVSSLNSDITSIKKEYARMVYLAYLNRAHNNKLMFLLSSKDFNQAYKRLKYLNEYSDYRKRQIAIIRGVQLSLNKEIIVLDSTRKLKRTILTDQELETKKLKAEQDDKSAYLTSLKGKESDLKKKLSDKMKLVKKLEAEIDRFIKEEIERNKAIAAAKVKRAKEIESNKKASKTSTVSSNKNYREVPNSSSDDISLSNTFRSNKGRLPWPLEKGVISQSFGNYTHPVYKDVKMHNNGIDILTSLSANVRAVFDGEVRQVVSISGLNYVVIIKHGNFYTLYQNLVAVNVKKDDKVRCNQNIGKLGSESDSQSSTLHFEIYEDFKRLDPELWLLRH